MCVGKCFVRAVLEKILTVLGDMVCWRLSVLIKFNKHLFPYIPILLLLLCEDLVLRPKYKVWKKKKSKSSVVFPSLKKAPQEISSPPNRKNPL